MSPREVGLTLKHRDPKARRRPPAGDEPEITLRPATPRDENFLFALFASTRAAEMATTGWPAAQQEVFLRSQFNARRRHYAQVFAGAEPAIVQRGGEAIGTLMVQRAADEIRVVDLALRAEHRGRGIGRRLLGALQDEARATHRPLRLQVLKADRAAQLYARVGFAPTGENGLYLKMEWRAD